MIYAWKRDETKRPKLTQKDYIKFMERKAEIDERIQEQIMEIEDEREKELRRSNGVYA